MPFPIADESTLAVIRSFVIDSLGLAEEAFDPGCRFADLGVDSFAAQRLRRLLAEAHGVELPLTAFLGSECPREVARALAAAQATSGEPPRTSTGAATAAYREGSGPPGSAPLTEVQAAYWVGRRPDLPLGGSATFWFQEYDRAPAGGDPHADLDRLEAAWNRLVDLHPMLRATVGRDGRQRCAPPGAWAAFERTDLRGAAAEVVDGILARIRAQRSHQVRDPGRWPLFDLHASLLPGGTLRLSVGFDVLVLDFASWRLLMAQWGRLVAHPDAEIAVPAADFLDILRRRATDPVHLARRARAEAYWTARLGEIPAGPVLPLARPAAEIAALSSPRFTRRRRSVPAASWSQLRERCTEHGVSPSAAVLTAFMFALHRWGATDRFAVTTTLFDRPEDIAGIDGVVGDFTTTALVAAPELDPLTWPGFAATAREVNARFWAAVDHRAFSAVELFRRLPGHPATGTDPVLPSHPVVFTSGLGVGDEVVATRWLGREVFGLSQTPQVLIDHLVWLEDGELVLVVDAVAEAFAPEFLAGFTDACHRLVTRLATDAAAWTAPDLGWEPDFRTPGPLDVTPFGRSGPLLDDPRRTVARRLPQEPALLGDGVALGHAELDRRARAVAAALVGDGVRPGGLVLVGLPKGVAQIVATLGVGLAGAGYVPADTGWPASRLASVCDRAAIRHALVLDRVPLELPEEVTVRVLGDGGTATDLPEPLAEPVAAAPDDLAYVIFTSGSTGTPKGVAIEHRQVRTTIDDVTDRFGIGAADRVLGLSALSFDLSVYDIFGVLGAGGALILPDEGRQRDPQHWCELIERLDVTVWNTAPALLEILVEYAESAPGAGTQLATLRTVLLSGDWIPVRLPDRLRTLVPGTRVVSLGGATEAAIWSITYPVGSVEPNWPSIPYGRALRGQRFHVLDAEGRPCPVGETGELYIGGDGVARGYLGDPAQTAERFAVHPALGARLYRTGDTGCWLPEGEIRFLGRVDRQVKINGFRIELDEIESVLGHLPGVRQAVASSVPGPDGRPRLVVHVATRLDERSLADTLRAALPDYMLPARIVRLAELPVTGNGKVDYANLPNPFRRARPVAASAEPDTPGPAPVAPSPASPPAVVHPAGPVPVALSPTRSGTSGTVRDAVHEILGSDVDLQRGLVAAGAVSLDVVRLANAIEDATGVRVSFPDLVAFDSISALLAAYDRQADGPAPVTPPQVPLPTGLDLVLRLPLPQDRPLSATLSEAGRWLHELTENLAGSAVRIDEILHPDALEVRILPAGQRIPAMLVDTTEPVGTTGPSRTAGRVIEDGSGTPFPLTEMQLAYLVGRVDPGLGSRVAPHYYTEADVIDLDVDRLAAALHAVIGRHPMLRARITPDTRQVVAPASATVSALPVLDLRDRQPEDRARLLAELREDRSHHVADPATGPMLTLSVTRLHGRVSRLHLGMDLLFCDAQSAVVVVQELRVAYVDPASLPEAPTATFREWVDTLAEAEQGEHRARALDYWSTAARSMAEGPALPLRTPDRLRFTRHRATFDSSLWSQLRAEAHRGGVTPTGLLLGAFSEVLRRAGGGDRFSLVLTTFDRPAAHRGVVGDYTSTLLLKVDGHAGTTVGRRVEALQHRLWADLEHSVGASGVHGNEVLRMMSAARGQQAVLPVVFSSGLGSTVDVSGASVDASVLLAGFGTTVHAVSQTPNVMLDCQVFEADDELRINFDAVDGAFPPGHVAALLDAFSLILQVMADPSAWHHDDPAGLDESPLRLLERPTGAGYPLQAVRRPAVRHGDAVLEGQVAGVLAEAMGTAPDDLDRERSFFELGATSLTLVQAHRQLRGEVAPQLTVLELFAHPTIRALAAHLASRGVALGAAAPRSGTDSATLAPWAGGDGAVEDPLLRAARARGRSRRAAAAALR